MKKEPATNKSMTGRKLVVILLPFAFAMLSASSDPLFQQAEQNNTDTRLELLNRLESGEKVTSGDIKTCLKSYRPAGNDDTFSETGIFSEIFRGMPEIVSIPELQDLLVLPETEFFSLEDYDEYERDTPYFPDIVLPDEETLERIKEQLSKAVEEAHGRVNMIREKELEMMLDEMKQATEEMKRETERLREEIRKHRVEKDIVIDSKAY